MDKAYFSENTRFDFARFSVYIPTFDNDVIPSLENSKPPSFDDVIKVLENTKPPSFADVIREFEKLG
jgi:hypothetical protein